MRRIAFTLTELVVTLIVITLAVTVTLPITKKKLEKADKIGYYRAYQIANDISKQLKIKDFADTYLESSSASANYDFEYCQQPLYSCTFEYREKVTCEGQEHTWTEVPIEYCQPDKLSEITDCDWNDQDCDIHFTSDPTPMGYTVGDKYSSDATIKENPFDRVIKIAKEKIFEFDKFLARITKPTNPNHIGLCPAAWASGTCTLSPEDDGSYQGGCSCGQTQITVDDEGDCSMAAAQMLNTCWGCYVDYHFSGPSGGGSGSGSGSGSGGGSGGGSGNYHACDSFAKLHSEIPNNPWTFNGSCKWVDASFGLCKNIKDKYNDARGKYKLNDPTESCLVVKEDDVKGAVTSGNFRADAFNNPQIVLDNGMIIHILSDTPAIIPVMKATNNSTEAATASNSGFTIFIDINGKSGKSKLYEDVFPFYLMLDGNVVPAHDLSGIGGANDEELLSFGVIYNDFTTGSRQVKSLGNNISYQKAACWTGAVTAPAYCKMVDSNAILERDLTCKAESANCKIIVNRPFVMFGNLFE